MTVYVDVLFLINALMDYITLLAAARLSGLYPKRFRLLFASGIGGGYAILATKFSVLSHILGWLLSSILICAVAFSGLGNRAFPRLYALYLMVAASFAGAAWALGAAANQTLLINGIYYFTIPMRLFVFCAVVSYAISGIWLRGDAKHRIIRREVESMQIALWGHTVSARILHDTGNDLIEPISRRAVLVIQLDTAQQLFGTRKTLIERLPSDGAASCLSNMPTEYVQRFGLLPYHAVGTAHGMLLYFRPDWVRNAKGKAIDCVVAIHTETHGMKGYEGLIGAEKE